MPEVVDGHQLDVHVYVGVSHFSAVTLTRVVKQNVHVTIATQGRRCLGGNRTQVRYV